MARRTKWVRDTDTLRECSACHELKPFDGFYTYKTRPRWRPRRCIPCVNKQNADYLKICPSRSGILKPPRYIDTETTRQCSLCYEVKPRSEFCFLKDKGRLNRRCKFCERKIDKHYRQFEDYKEKARKRAMIRQKGPKVREYQLRVARQAKQDRITVIIKYGGKCACCPEDDLPFLCIDHINGGGSRERKSQSSHKYWRNLAANPISDRYQVLCHNCNMAKQFNGGICPHKSGLFRDNPAYA